MPTRKWLVIATEDHKTRVLDRAWTERGAWRKRNYWSVLFRAVGNRGRLDVVHAN
jgi:hypothetical protein